MLTGSYASWANWLERFAREEVDDCAGLPPMRGEQLGAVAAQRFAARCAKALDQRLTAWARGLQRDALHARDPQQLRIALVNARSRLTAIRRFTESELLITEVRTGLCDSLRMTVTTLQQDLEQQASRAHPSAREVMIAVMRDVRLTTVLEGPLPPTPMASTTTAWDTVSPIGPRRILLTTKDPHG